MEKEDEKTSQVSDQSRRDFLKFGSATAAVATVGASMGAGFIAGRDPDANVGWGRTEAGKDQFFDRKPFEVDVAPTLELVGKAERPEWGDWLFNRRGVLKELIADGFDITNSNWTDIPEPKTRAYYEKYPDRWPKMQGAIMQMAAHADNTRPQFDRYALAWAYDRSFLTALATSHFPPRPQGHPDVEDFKLIGNVADKQVEFQSPTHASKLIKQMAHKYGMSLCTIAKFDERFMVKNMMRGMPGGSQNWDESVPKHWKNVIIFGVPMNWDPMYAAAGYSTSFDAYWRCQQATGLMAAFLGQLGYAARPQWPGNDYEIMVPPLAAASGMGEIGRGGTLITPEVGTNIRLAAVITNLDLEADKPIDIGVKHFCEECKICADTCPSGSISSADKPDVVSRGFRKYDFNQDSCYEFWNTASTADGLGCRICVAVCPYTRKNNWMHVLVKEADPRDPTGLTRKTLLAMQHNFFYYPDAQDFHPEWTGGKFAGYHQPPEWLRSENYLKVKKTWEYDGNWEGI